PPATQSGSPPRSRRRPGSPGRAPPRASRRRSCCSLAPARRPGEWCRRSGSCVRPTCRPEFYLACRSVGGVRPWSAMTRWALRVGGFVLVAAGCSSASQPQCLHPCDLGQTLRIEITGDEPAATISVSGDCEANGACAVTAPCRSLDIQLKNGGPGP